MSVTTCSACVLAASAGGAVGGYLAVGRRGRSRSRRAVRGGRTMRPGRVACAPLLVLSAAAGHVGGAGIPYRSGMTTTARGERPGIR
jgi:hypothetical protein